MENCRHIASKIFAADSHVVGENPDDDDSDMTGLHIHGGAGVRPGVGAQPQLTARVTEYTTTKIVDCLCVNFLCSVLVDYRQRKPERLPIIPPQCIECWETTGKKPM